MWFLQNIIVLETTNNALNRWKQWLSPDPKYTLIFYTYFQNLSFFNAILHSDCLCCGLLSPRRLHVRNQSTCCGSHHPTTMVTTMATVGITIATITSALRLFLLSSLYVDLLESFEAGESVSVVLPIIQQVSRLQTALKADWGWLLPWTAPTMTRANLFLIILPPPLAVFVDEMGSQGFTPLRGWTVAVSPVPDSSM